MKYNLVYEKIYVFSMNHILTSQLRQSEIKQTKLFTTNFRSKNCLYCRQRSIMKWVKKRRKKQCKLPNLILHIFHSRFCPQVVASFAFSIWSWDGKKWKKGTEKRRICSISFFFVNFQRRGNRTRKKKFFFILNWLYFFSFPISHWRTNFLVLFSNEKKK